MKKSTNIPEDTLVLTLNDVPTYVFFYCKRDNLAKKCTMLHYHKRQKREVVTPVLCDACRKSMRIVTFPIPNPVTIDENALVDLPEPKDE